MSQISRVEYSVIRRLSHRHENQKGRGLKKRERGKTLESERKRDIRERLGFSCLASRNPLIVVEAKCSGLSNKVTRTSSRDMCPGNTTLGTHVLQLTQCTTSPLSHHPKSHPQRVLCVCCVVLCCVVCVYKRKTLNSPPQKKTNENPLASHTLLIKCVVGVASKL